MFLQTLISKRTAAKLAAEFTMTSLQGSTKAANWQPNEEQQCSCFCASLQTFRFAACFQLPSNCEWCFKRKTLSEFGARAYDEARTCGGV